MPHDLLVKNGTVVDGSGMPRYRADVAVRHGRIAAIGRIREAAREGIDAAGPGGTPRFVAGAHPRLRGRPHPHGRAGLLGSLRDLLVLAWGHHRGDGELWLHAGPPRQGGLA